MRSCIHCLLILSFVFLAGCETDKPCACPDLYAPVCGEDGKTYANACQARCEDVQYIEGECPVNGIGQVMFSGDSLCGFLVGIFGEVYKPDTLPPTLSIDEIWVNIRFRRMNNFFTCENPYGHYQLIEVLSIEEILNH